MLPSAVTRRTKTPQIPLGRAYFISSNFIKSQTTIFESKDTKNLNFYLCLASQFITLIFNNLEINFMKENEPCTTNFKNNHPL